MSWDQGYTSPDERAAQDRAAEEARQRARMQPFERRLLDYLGEISASLAKLAAVSVLDSAGVADAVEHLSTLVAGSSGDGRAVPLSRPQRKGTHSAPAEFVADTAAAGAVMQWIDSDPNRGLVGCTPAMVAGVAVNAYRKAINTSTAAGVDGGVGAESVVAPDSAHPTSQPQ